MLQARASNAKSMRLQAPEVLHAPPHMALLSRNERLESAIRPWRRDWREGAGAIGVHLALLAMLLSLPPPQRGGARAAGGGMRAVLVAAPAPAAAAPAPPTPVQPPQPVVQKPAPAKKAAIKAAEPKPVAKTPASATTTAAGSAGKPDARQQAPDPNAEMNGLLSGIRNNWLRPPAMPPSFRCRVKVDYRAGGMVSMVTVLDKCGGQLLDDSIERAIWKTQPLPWNAARGQDGSVILEFTP